MFSTLANFPFLYRAFFFWLGCACFLFAQVERKGFVYKNSPDDDRIFEVVLPRLLNDGSVLDGKYVQVSNKELSLNDALTRMDVANQDFRFVPHAIDASKCSAFVRSDHDCSYFDDVNVYYHLDRFAEEFWVQKMRVPILFKVKAFTHTTDNFAFALPIQKEIYFPHGHLLGKDSAKGSDMIYHEYTHLVLHELGFSANETTSLEHKALHESYADYFAASFTNDPRMGEWEYDCPPRFDCTGEPNDTEIRTLETNANVWNWNKGAPSLDLKYGRCIRKNLNDGKCKRDYFTQTQTYVWSMIWSSALWEIRYFLGAEKADRLILQAIRIHKGDKIDFADALYALVQADLQLYGGQNRILIRDIMKKRGIESVAVARETTEKPTLERIYLFPNPANASLNLAFPFTTTGTLRIWNLLGQEMHTQRLQNQDALHIPTTQFPNGAYFLELNTDHQLWRRIFHIVHL